jgi:hypothetical protein
MTHEDQGLHDSNEIELDLNTRSHRIIINDIFPIL